MVLVPWVEMKLMHVCDCESSEEWTRLAPLGELLGRRKKSVRRRCAEGVSARCVQAVDSRKVPFSFVEVPDNSPCSSSCLPEDWDTDLLRIELFHIQ
jgi:hypothetical protein